MIKYYLILHIKKILITSYNIYYVNLYILSIKKIILIIILLGD